MRDDALVAAAKRGGEEAWAELYARHAGRLLVWLGSLATGDAAAAPEDVAAEAWLVAAQKVTTFTGTADEFAGWLFGIARKVNANGRRRTGRRATSPHAVGPDEDALWGRSDGGIGDVEGRDLVRRTLAGLPPREAEVLACREVVGLDVAATAEALGIRPTAVRVAHHRALKRLRAAQQPAAPVDPPERSERAPRLDVTFAAPHDRTTYRPV